MQTSKQNENEPTVGNNFFENIPPVGKTNYLTSSRKFDGVKQVTTEGITETRESQNSPAELKAPETVVIKGFGESPLFVLGMLTKAEATEECVRLDDDTGKKSILSEAEQICKRNSTIVRKLYQEEEQIEKDNDNDYEVSEDEIIPKDFPDEILASDYSTRRGK